jgi:cation diffusion facilitator CzcD-associated flavoprotein CzcO
MKIAIIGAGPSGIAAGHELLKQGFNDFTIFDEQDAPGGTWRQHSYPGLACDVWAHSYTFSYAPNPDWSASFVGYAEIQRYLADCCKKFGLDPHLHLNTSICRAEYSGDGRWTLESARGSLGEFDIIINAMGNQHTPLYPGVDGVTDFQGDSWHSTEWNHDVDLYGRKVVVVGSAAAAVQIVTEVAKKAGHLTVLQRSANWIMPRNRKVYRKRQQWRFRHIPGWITLTRWVQRMMMGQVEYAVTIGHRRMGQFENMVKKYIEETIDDPALREKLVPDTSYGCKRGLVSDDFYPTLNRDNVELLPEGLQQVASTGIVTTSGRKVDADVIIYCTGYKILDYDRFDVIGRDGRNLGQELAGDPRCHKGISAPGFPNYFFAVGPNGLVLNVSYLITAERNVATIVGLLSAMREQSGRTMEVKKEVFERYNQWMDERFERFSWGASNCNSYYTAGSGHPPFLFPGNFKEYTRCHKEAGLHEYELGNGA